jgi:hypothetical protein
MIKIKSGSNQHTLTFMKQPAFFLFAFFCVIIAQAQHRTENIVIITLDGMRWQEVFAGVDETLMNDSVFNRDRDGTKQRFWAESAEERRKKLFPFFWSTVAEQGQLYGNRRYNNKLDNANPYWFSYPGYNEIFTGYPDTAVNSNDKILNPNENVLEFISKQKGYTGKIAAFTTWDVFPYIFNSRRNGLYVNADVDTLKFATPGLQLVNDMQFLSTKPLGVRPDLLTYMAGREYLKAYKPKLLYIAFDETDDFAHGGQYDQYIGSAHAEDMMIADLWKTLQSLPQYKDKTTLIVTCDHGRGDKIKANWQHHGSKIEDAHELWLAVIGPDTKPAGELKTPGQLYQKQIAATIANLLGFRFIANHPVGDPVSSIYEK